MRKVTARHESSHGEVICFAGEHDAVTAPAFPKEHELAENMKVLGGIFFAAPVGKLADRMFYVDGVQHARMPIKANRKDGK